MIRRPPRSTRTDTLFPYTTLFRSSRGTEAHEPGRHCRGPVPKGQTGSGRHGPLDSRRLLIKLGQQRRITFSQTNRERNDVEADDPGQSVADARSCWLSRLLGGALSAVDPSSEERRVGKEGVSTCWCRWSPCH